MRPSATILQALDQRASGETKIPVATQYVKMMGAQLVLVHVLPPHTLDPSAVRPGEAFARTYLDAVAAQIQAAGVPAATVLRCGSAARTIVDEADTIGANLIILGANVRPRLSTMLVGSIADQVMRLASCPVLLVHPEPVQNGGVRTVRSLPRTPPAPARSHGATWACGRSRWPASSAASLERASSGQTSNHATGDVLARAGISAFSVCWTPRNVVWCCLRLSSTSSALVTTSRMGTTASLPRD